jgi:hypothetical protein
MPAGQFTVSSKNFDTFEVLLPCVMVRLGSGFLAQSRCDFLKFSFKLVLFSSYFSISLKSLKYGLFSFSEKGSLVCGYFPPEIQTFLPFSKKASRFQD